MSRRYYQAGTDTVSILGAELRFLARLVEGLGDGRMVDVVAGVQARVAAAGDALEYGRRHAEAADAREGRRGPGCSGRRVLTDPGAL
jgi:hypothetical protein